MKGERGALLNDLRACRVPNQPMTLTFSMTVKRLFFSLLILVSLATAATVSTARPTHAQIPEPTAIVDSVLSDLSARLGVKLNRVSLQSYTWEQRLFATPGLECDASGVNGAAQQTLGYIIIIRYKDVDYDYRALADGTRVFQCAKGVPLPPLVGVPATAVPGQPAATPVSVTAVPISPVRSVVNGFIAQTQPTAYNNPLAFVAADGNVYISDLTNKVLVSASALTGDATGDSMVAYPYSNLKKYYRRLSWSPDGTKLAFLDERNLTLYAVSSGQQVVQLAQNVSIGFSPAWSSDGGEIAYAVGTSTPANPGDPTSTEVFSQIQTISANGGAPRAVGQFPFGTACGGGGYDSAYSAYQDDAGYGGNAKLLAQIANGYLYTASCTGIGLGLTNLTNSGTWKRADLSSPALSADRSKLAAIVRDPKADMNTPGSAIELIDLKTGKGTKLNVSANPTQVAWSPDGLTLFYATRTPAGTLIVGENKPVAKTLFPESPFSVPLYTVELWRLPIAGGAPSKVFSQEAHGISRISVSADGANAVVDVVTSYSAMAALLNNGGTAPQALAVAPRVEMVVVPLTGAAGSTPYKIGIGGQATPTRGQFVANPVPVLAGSAPPVGAGAPVLAVGMSVVVSVKDGSLNLRGLPNTTSAVKGFLPKGTVVVITAGPQAGEGFRWWQVKAPSGNIGWVVDQVSENGEIINALTPQ